MQQKIKWIKFSTDFFDSENCLLIDNLSRADSILVIWIKILALAGKQNCNGVFLAPNGKPYTIRQLSVVLRRKESLVRLALDTLVDFKMIKIEDGMIILPSWDQIQSVKKGCPDGEYIKNYMRDYRLSSRKEGSDKSEGTRKLQSKDDSKLYGKEGCKDDCKDDCKLYSKDGCKGDVKSLEEEAEAEAEKEAEAEAEERSERVPPDADSCKELIALFNSCCPSLPCVRSLPKRRIKSISKALESYTVDELKKCFEIAEKSDFLKGRCDSEWVANFDWLIRAENVAKVLEGNYNNSPESSGSFESDEFFSRAVNNTIIKHMSLGDDFAENIVD